MPTPSPTPQGPLERTAALVYTSEHHGLAHEQRNRDTRIHPRARERRHELAFNMVCVPMP
jgi:hypothetical protein